MGLWADWKEIRKKSKADGLRARINTLELKRRSIMRAQMKLTNQAEVLEGCCELDDDGQPILTAWPLILQNHPGKHRHSNT